MGGSHFSSMKENAREEWLSSDANRLQALASRDLQNLLADASTDVSGAPISGLSGPCSLTGIVASYQMALSAAQAFFWNTGDGSLTADDSAYEVARWAAQNLTFGAPSGQPRIDLVVATPAAVDTDSESRTVLVDPVARTTSPQNVFKTTNPVATLAVVAGTPGATPAPPAVPAGAIALFEVYVPTGASDSTGFTVTPRIFRRAPFPWTNLTGVVSGFRPQWDLSITPGSADSTLSFGAIDDCRVMIDGEYIETIGAVIEVFQDAGGNNPFAVAADAHWHKPYYLYLVGGRHAPQGGTVFHAPVVLVESLVPPFTTTGRPTAAITTPRGSAPNAACCYIGLGFVAAGTTKRLPCIMGEEFTRISGSKLGDVSSLQHTAGSTSFEAFDVNAPPVIPAVTSAVLARLVPGSTVGSIAAAPDDGTGAAPAPGFVSPFEGILFSDLFTGGAFTISDGVLPVNPAAPKFWAQAQTGAIFQLSIFAFEHKVRRLRY